MGSQEVNRLEGGVVISFDFRGAGTGLTFPVGCGVTVMAAWTGFVLADRELTGTGGLEKECTAEHGIDSDNSLGKAEMYVIYFLAGHLLNSFTGTTANTFRGEPRDLVGSAVGLFTAERTRFPDSSEGRIWKCDPASGRSSRSRFCRDPF